MREPPNIHDFLNDPMRIYGLIVFMVRAKEESQDANVIFDPHAACFGLLLSQTFQDMLDAGHPRLLHFPQRPTYFLTEQDAIFLSLRSRLCELVRSPAIQRSIRNRNASAIVGDYFSPFRLSDVATEAAIDAVIATIGERRSES